MAWHARYRIKWGHKVQVGRNEWKEVTREELNEGLENVETPEEPEIPFCAQHVYDWWWELNARRGPGFDSLAPLTYTELESWKAATGHEIVCTPIEARWLMAMDNAWLNAVAEERKAKQERDRERAEMEARNKPRAGVPRRR